MRTRVFLIVHVIIQVAAAAAKHKTQIQADKNSSQQIASSSLGYN